MIGIPGHEKDIVDAINACDKRYLKDKMCMVGTPEADDCKQRMDAHAMIGEKVSSWVVTCKQLLEDKIRVHGVKSYNKHSKRETKQKMKKRIYHLQDMEGVLMTGMKKKVMGLDNGKYMGISSMYNFRCDPDLGIGKAACRRIPCVCLSCLEILNLPWEKGIVDREQPRYGVNERCIYWRNFMGYNNWRVVDLVSTNDTPEEEEKVYEITLHGIEARMNE